MRIGSLFSGYGGLDMAATATIGGTVAWHCEVDTAASRILAHHWPDVPNLGDITTVDWSQVEPVDVLTGGFPCQDVSHAGKRAGIRPGTRSGLWSHFAYAIDQLRPELVVIENVRGLLSARAHSDVEPCAFCVGDDTDGALRALGAVLGDLADLGYDARWGGLRAADAGAPHGRFRVFIVAYPEDQRHERGRPARGWGRGLADGGDTAPDADHDGRQRGTELHSEPLTGQHGEHRRHPDRLGVEARGMDWGGYAAAVHRWEHAIGRPAPAPTETGKTGNPRLSPAFDEWMMGLPEGHVTGVPGISHNDQLKALGNGVVPQQAELALRWLLFGEWDGSDGNGTTLFPTPSVADGIGGHLTRSGDRSDELLLPGVARHLALLPTPAVNDMGAGKTVADWDAWTERMKAAHGNGNGHGKSLSIEALRIAE
jgi:DNA (cytosine-5)-methyltransferase 1